MKFKSFLILSLAIFFSLSSTEIDQLCQFKTAVELCTSSHGYFGDEAGFIAARSAMQTYKDNNEIVLMLKECMCRCTVSLENKGELFQIAKDVTEQSSKPMIVGIAWKNMDEIDIALNIFKRIDQKPVTGFVTEKEFFEVRALLTKKISYERLNDTKNVNEVTKLLDNYPWMQMKYPDL